MVKLPNTSDNPLAVLLTSAPTEKNVQTRVINNAGSMRDVFNFDKTFAPVVLPVFSLWHTLVPSALNASDQHQESSLWQRLVLKQLKKNVLYVCVWGGGVAVCVMGGYLLNLFYFFIY